MKSFKLNKISCCEDIIQCVFDLNDLDIAIYKKLSKIKELRADDLAEDIGKDRSTVYRSLQKLNCCGICNKKIRKIKSGGYYHVYTCINDNEIKKNLEKCIDTWYKKMKQTIKNLDQIS